jgi:hypothetical protein
MNTYKRSADTNTKTKQRRNYIKQKYVPLDLKPGTLTTIPQRRSQEQVGLDIMMKRIDMGL